MKFYFNDKFVEVVRFINDRNIYCEVLEYCYKITKGEDIRDAVREAGDITMRYVNAIKLNTTEEALMYGLGCFFMFKDNEGLPDDEVNSLYIRLLVDNNIICLGEKPSHRTCLVNSFVSELEDEGYYKDMLDAKEKEQLIKYVDMHELEDDTIADFVRDATALKNISQHPNAHCYSGLTLSCVEEIEEHEENPFDDCDCDNEYYLYEVLRFTDSDMVLAIRY